jgi:hypothetical protein
VVLWATGYRSDYSWISIPDVVRDGRVEHRRGVTQVPGLYFLDLPWQHTRGSALAGFAAAYVFRPVDGGSGRPFAFGAMSGPAYRPNLSEWMISPSERPWVRWSTGSWVGCRG